MPQLVENLHSTANNIKHFFFKNQFVFIGVHSWFLFANVYRVFIPGCGYYSFRFVQVKLLVLVKVLDLWVGFVDNRDSGRYWFIV